jgi:hypothetical protein
MANFKLNPGALDAIGRQAVEAFNAKLQPVLDRFHQEYAGKSVEEIKPALARVWSQNTDGGSITEPNLTTWATTISEGNRIVLKNAS